MAKDPAMLWYWNDWIGGTMTMSRFEKGCYMDIMGAMFNSGPLSLEKIKRVLGTDFGQSWPAIQGKFKKTDDDLFFNERMELERERRKTFITKQSENGKKGGKPKRNPTLNPTLKPNETQPLSQAIPIVENRNENTNEGIQGGTGETEFRPVGIVPDMAEQFKLENPEMYFNQAEVFPAVREIAEKIKTWMNLEGAFTDPSNIPEIKSRWAELIPHVKAHQHFRSYSLPQINKYFSSITQSFINGRKQQPAVSNQQAGTNGKSAGVIKLANSLAANLGLAGQ
ncbi:hypothetical protein [Pinibacter soli]|uniref:DUF1376 domain-containing protein n=1 Tax=Pinibacter soli TaxID=3044211 RepID=A0ABT6RBR9_9BACT|nr:hypothetical protein [Pinibacter soli]MDI3319975.1 hypothetical protein [Pinibacter soli]